MFEVRGRVKDQDLLVLDHGPKGGCHWRNGVEREGVCSLQQFAG